MPRRNRTGRRRPRPVAEPTAADYTPTPLTYQQMAFSLVERGLASRAVLGPIAPRRQLDDNQEQTR